MTSVHWAEGDPAVPDARVVQAVEAALEHGGRPGLQLNVVFVGAETLTEMHAQHLDDPTATDVITFDLSGGPGADGELYVSVPRAREVARARGFPLEQEILLYVVHGALHLCGLDDQEPASRAEMRVAERTVMRGLGFELSSGEADHEWGGLEGDKGT